MVTPSRNHREATSVWVRNLVFAILLGSVAGCLSAPGCSSKGYQREYGKWAYVWFDGDGRHARYLEDAEGNLTILSNKNYAATADYVYLKGVKLPEADPATFEMLTYPYSKDAKRVFCGSIPIAGANPATFQVLGGFLDPYVLAKAKTFELEVGPITTVPGDTRVVAARAWSTDGKTCFYGPTPVVGARAESFKILSDFYATDGTKVFCGYRTLEEADVATFRVVRFMEAEDRNYRYLKWDASERADRPNETSDRSKGDVQVPRK